MMTMNFYLFKVECLLWLLILWLKSILIMILLLCVHTEVLMITNFKFQNSLLASSGSEYTNRGLIDLLCLMPLSAISWRPVLVVEEAGAPGENHRPRASNW